ncbi:MAG TPA: DUF6602 domain-containing protein [Burkholderiales bacterium]|nr:DUF6602 domain-containing protein [Burkholderiales bacterium]
MQRHYAGLSKQMLLQIESISEQMSHQGEKGRNNEAILKDFLVRSLPTRYTLSTGKVVSVGGVDSGQIDLIVHDRLETPAFLDSLSWSLVPVESVFAVLSVKTSLDKSELRDAMRSLASVRSLPRKAAQLQVNGNLAPIEESLVLRPRAFVFAFKSTWAAIQGCEAAFVDLLSEFEDDLRPNAVCILDSGFVVRTPYTTAVTSYGDHPLLHFFQFLVKTLDIRPRYRTDLSKYFSEDYGQTKGA